MAVKYDRLLLRPDVIIVTFLTLASSVCCMSDTEALIKLKQSFAISRVLDSWDPQSSPCQGGPRWKGVLCNRGAVTAVNLQGLGLSGTIDVVALRGISGLRIINFSNNSFTGQIPELQDLRYLRAIYLAHNGFSGEIPSEFFSKMTFLKKLWLADNKFKGSVPESLSALARLIELHLENNSFSGRIPSLSEAKNLVSLDLSGNEFSGEIPEELGEKFGPAAFLRNPSLCGETLGRECADEEDDEGGADARVIAAMITSGVVFVTVAVLMVVKSKRRRREGDTDAEEYTGGGSGKGPNSTTSSVEVHVSSLNKKEMESVRRAAALKGESNNGKSGGVAPGPGPDIVIVNEEKGVFGMPELMKASAEVLGGSAMGSSYKAVMANGVAVVVKRVKGMNVGGKEYFDAEVRRLATVRHRNVLAPLAYHFRQGEKLIVSEYVPRGSLLYALHGEHSCTHSELNWPTRLRIVQGIAKGLAYLHKELGSLKLPHGNLKSSNVLLGPDYEPLLSDYGFAHLIEPSSLSQSLFAYTSPEASEKPSPKSDVYCLGIVVLEVLTGKFPSQYLGGTGKLGGTDVVQLATATTTAEGADDGGEGGGGLPPLDPEIAKMRGSVGRMQSLMRFAVECVEADPEKRPGVADSVKRIDEIVAAEAEAAGSSAVTPLLRD